jgi:hypothetical protein
MSLPFPALHLVEQRFERPRVDDLPGAVHAELAGVGLARVVAAGDSVAVAVGSRGIRDIDRVVRCVVDELRLLGAAPFIVPAMGSHGGATAEGQREVLAGLGVTEAAVGCEVRASMDVVEVDRTAAGTPVYVDRHAAGAAHLLVVNRVKPHTKLSGPVESGLCKMCLIGLGKQRGAQTWHREAERIGWDALVAEAVPRLAARTPLRLGLALIQNAYEELAAVRAVPAPELLAVEPALLERARRLTGRLPAKKVDLLIVDEMGKEIAGTGMDTTVTGRKPGSPVRVTHLFVRDLTERSHGNAQGIGLADFTTRRLVDRVDFAALYVNSRTAFRTDTCKIPMTFQSDREALAAAVQMAGAAERPESYRVIWIRNTLELERVIVSQALLEELRGRPDASVVAGPLEPTFDRDGNLRPPW